jgi:hypothetical protein
MPPTLWASSLSSHLAHLMSAATIRERHHEHHKPSQCVATLRAKAGAARHRCELPPLLRAHKVAELRAVEQQRADDEGVGGEQPGRTVGRRLRDHRRADRGRGAGRFSTMMVAPSRCCRLGCSSRAIASEVPPAANGLMMRMMFAAAGCARATTGASNPAATSERLLSTYVSIPVTPLFWAHLGQCLGQQSAGARYRAAFAKGTGCFFSTAERGETSCPAGTAFRAVRWASKEVPDDHV